MREIIPLLALLVLLAATVLFGGQAAQLEHPAELLKLAQDFQEWRAPPDGIPDYADRAAQQIAELREFRERLSRLPDVRSWPVHA